MRLSAERHDEYYGFSGFFSFNNMAERVGLDFRHLAQVVVTTRHKQ
jgi:hypothetical protein